MRVLPSAAVPAAGPGAGAKPTQGAARFERVKELGRGSFGCAILVKRKADGEQFVIKEIDVSRMQRAEREASHLEAKLLAAMSHPNVVRSHESFVERGKLCIVMDYCSGGDLYRRLQQQRGKLLAEEQVLDWFVQLCLALKHVHDRKILHRDIKSQNVFISGAGLLKLGDFGVSKVLDSTSQFAATAVGTPYYMSPEICQNHRYDQRSDIWSLGCLLYEMATLKHAFDAQNMKMLIHKIVRSSYQPVSSAHYTKGLRDIVDSMIAKSPSKRPTVNQLLANPILRARIEKFLSRTVMAAEFAHTVLHGKPRRGDVVMRAPPARESSAPPSPRAAPSAPSPKPQSPHLNGPAGKAPPRERPAPLPAAAAAAAKPPQRVMTKAMAAHYAAREGGAPAAGMPMPARRAVVAGAPPAAPSPQRRDIAAAAGAPPSQADLKAKMEKLEAQRRDIAAPAGGHPSPQRRDIAAPAGGHPSPQRRDIASPAGGHPSPSRLQRQLDAQQEARRQEVKNAAREAAEAHARDHRRAAPPQAPADHRRAPPPPGSDHSQQVAAQKRRIQERQAAAAAARAADAERERRRREIARERAEREAAEARARRIGAAKALEARRQREMEMRRAAEQQEKAQRDAERKREFIRRQEEARANRERLRRELDGRGPPSAEIEVLAPARPDSAAALRLARRQEAAAAARIAAAPPNVVVPPRSPPRHLAPVRVAAAPREAPPRAKAPSGVPSADVDLAEFQRRNYRELKAAAERNRRQVLGDIFGPAYAAAPASPNVVASPRPPYAVEDGLGEVEEEPAVVVSESSLPGSRFFAAPAPAPAPPPLQPSAFPPRSPPRSPPLGSPGRIASALRASAEDDDADCERQPSTTSLTFQPLVDAGATPVVGPAADGAAAAPPDAAAAAAAAIGDLFAIDEEDAAEFDALADNLRSALRLGDGGGDEVTGDDEEKEGSSPPSSSSKEGSPPSSSSSKEGSPTPSSPVTPQRGAAMPPPASESAPPTAGSGPASGRFVLDGEEVELNVAEDGSAAMRAEALRAWLEEALGADVLVAAYQRMQEVTGGAEAGAAEEDEEAEEQRAVADLRAILGPGNVRYLTLIHQLIVCEDAIFDGGK